MLKTSGVFVLNKDPQSWTPTLTGFGTASPVQFQWVREGKFLVAYGYFTSGTVQGVLASLTLPNGLLVDASYLPINATSTQAGQFVGTYGENLASGAGYMVVCTATNANLIYFADDYSSATNDLTPANGNAVTNNGVFTAVYFRVPIASWSAND
jgi:hypothetical protein